MANIITNIIKASAEVLDALRCGDEEVDFNALIPLPPEAANMTTEYTATGLAMLLTGQVNFKPYYWDLLGGLQLSFIMDVLTKQGGIAAFTNDDEFEKFVTMLREHRKTGKFSGVGQVYPSRWMMEHWGTHENTSGASQIPGGVQFNTVWYVPHPVIEELATQFLDHRIDYSWADEDIGRNCGRRIFQFGGVFEVPIKDPVDFALNVTGKDRTGFRKSPETGKWDYYDS